MRTLLLFVAALSLLAESAAGLKWTAPPGWKNEGSRPMRAATYSVGGAECGVYFFGPGEGGSVQANIDRWRGQMLDSSGKPAQAQIAHRTIHGIPVTTIDSTGTYTGMGGPMTASKPVPGYRLLGAIVQGSGGNIFIKFAGPAKTLDANHRKFELLLDSFQKRQP